MMKEKDINKVNWQLIAKDISGELSKEEQLHLTEELAGNSDLHDQLSHLWDDAKYAQELNTVDTDKAWSTVKENMQSVKGGLSISLKRFMSIAASLIIILASYYAFNLYNTTNNQQTITAENNQQSIKLIDGTVVDLNIGSRIQFPEEFEESNRTVQLEGEAFFDVTRDVEKPFIIHTKQIQIKVLGTSFNVKESPLNGDAVVAVSSGKVEVMHGDMKVTLVKGESAIFVAETNQLLKRTIENANYKAWKTKELEFDNAKLDEVFNTLENAYHISIELDSEISIDSMVLNATFSRYTINHVLESVCAPFNLEYRLSEGKYRITSVQ